MAEFDSYAYTHHIPCQNRGCRSYGKVHPRCECGPLGAGTEENYARGGEVFCSQTRSHKEGCEYFAEGGEVDPPPVPLPQFAEDSASTLGHAAVDRGLLGLIKDVGHPKMVEPEKHEKLLREVREQHAWRAQPSEQELPRTAGTRLGNAIADGDHEKAADLIHGHTLVGGASKANLEPIMQRLAAPLITEPPNPEGARAAADYLSSSIKGENSLDGHMSKLFNQDKLDLEPDESSRKALHDHLESAQADPLELLDSAGSVGHYLPVHGAQIGALAGRAVNYLNSLKPMSSQNAPLDTKKPIDKGAQAKYDRQLDIAQNPLLVLKHTQKGSLQPQDLQTLSTLYPALHQSMIKKATEQLIKKGDDAKSIPFAQRQTLSMLMGQPLDSTFTAGTMQAIVRAQAPQQFQAQAKAQAKKQKPATGVELNQINKVNELSKTPLQKLETKEP